MIAPPLTPLAAALLHVPAPERALVVGSADGEAALLLAREFPAARVRGVDSRPDLVREASARIGLDPEARVAFKVGGRRALPYPDGFFDLVVQVDGRPYPSEMARVLVPGGQLVLVRSRPGALATARQALLRRSLARRRLAVKRSAEAGNGNFLVARLEASDERASRD